MILAQRISSKNRLSRKRVHLPQQAVTGYDLPVLEIMTDHPEDLAVHQLVTEDAMLQYSGKCRKAAAAAFYELDHCDAVCKALVSQDVHSRNLSVVPGSQVRKDSLPPSDAVHAAGSQKLEAGMDQA